MKGRDPEHGWKVGLGEVEGQTEGRGKVRGGSKQPGRAEGPYSETDVSVKLLETRAAGGGMGRQQGPGGHTWSSRRAPSRGATG